MANDSPEYETNPSDPSSKKQQHYRISVLWKRIGLCVCVLLTVYGAVRLIDYFNDLHRSRQTTQELREALAEAQTAEPIPEEPDEVNEASSEEPPQPAAETAIPEQLSAEGTDGASTASGDLPATAESDRAAAVTDKLPAVEYPNGYALVPRIQELRKKSEYIIGWITMDDLDEPVVHKDNTFFLDHDTMGKKNVNGAIFMDQGTNLLTRPYTILLYGHNMKTGAMFGNLRKYEEFSYCFKHRFLQFDTLYEEGKYEIFAVATISLTPGKAKYIDLAGLQSTDRKTRAAALEALINVSPHGRFNEVDEEDQILLLITCVGDDDERLVVAAKKMSF